MFNGGPVVLTGTAAVTGPAITALVSTLNLFVGMQVSDSGGARRHNDYRDQLGNSDHGLTERHRRQSVPLTFSGIVLNGPTTLNVANTGTTTFANTISGNTLVLTATTAAGRNPSVTGLPLVNGMPSTSNLAVGMLVTGTNIAAGTTITSIVWEHRSRSRRTPSAPRSP